MAKSERHMLAIVFKGQVATGLWQVRPLRPSTDTYNTIDCTDVSLTLCDSTQVD